MSKSIKFKDEAYVDSSGTVFNQKPLSEIFGNNQKSLSGYAEIGGGIIFQWGTANGTGYKNFTKSFPNACVFVICDGAWANVNPAYKTLSGVDSWDRNGFTLGSFGYMKVGDYGEPISTQSYRNLTGTANFAGITRWFAIGY